jgi:hypothetical protein
MAWEDNFQAKLRDYKMEFENKDFDIPISIKIRVSSGCFHREHSPQAYQIIDKYLESNPNSYCRFEEHESGPELIIYLSLATGVINLVTAIIKSRKEGIKLGDHPRAPLELIIRYFNKKRNLKEENILTIDSSEIVNEDLIEKLLLTSTKKLISDSKDIKKSRINFKQM